MRLKEKNGYIKCFVDISTRRRCQTTIKHMECIASSQSSLW